MFGGLDKTVIIAIGVVLIVVIAVAAIVAAVTASSTGAILTHVLEEEDNK